LYAGNNPINSIDPSGKFTLSEALTTIDIAMTLDSAYSASSDLYHGNYKQATLEFVSTAFWGTAGLRMGFRGLRWWNKGREIRQIYNGSVRDIKYMVEAMEKAGKNTEEVADAVIKIRNEAKISARALMEPEEVVKLEARNMADYGDTIGPNLEWMLREYGSYEEIIDAATRTNFWYNLLFLSF
jgi:hypothetical protein